MLIYPTDALASPFPFGPRNTARQSAENFRLRADDGSIFPHSMLYDPAGKPIKPSDLPNTISILVHDRLEVQRAVATTTRRALDIENGFDLPALDLAPTEYPDLLEIGSLKKWPTQEERWLVARRGETITDFVICKRPGSVPNPQCRHHFDFRHINVDLANPAAVLSHWQDAKAKAERFLGCIYSK